METVELVPCPLEDCDKMTKPKGRGIHLARAHGIYSDSPGIRSDGQVHCKGCDKVFDTEKQMKMHAVSHQKIKCEYCKEEKSISGITKHRPVCAKKHGIDLVKSTALVPVDHLRNDIRIGSDDDIQLIASALFPDGIPAPKIVPALRWYDSTKELMQ